MKTMLRSILFAMLFITVAANASNVVTFSVSADEIGGFSPADFSKQVIQQVNKRYGSNFLKSYNGFVASGINVHVFTSANGACLLKGSLSDGQYPIAAGDMAWDVNLELDIEEIELYYKVECSQK